MNHNKECHCNEETKCVSGDECTCNEECSCHDDVETELLGKRIKELEEALLRSNAELLNKV